MSIQPTSYEMTEMTDAELNRFERLYDTLTELCFERKEVESIYNELQQEYLTLEAKLTECEVDASPWPATTNLLRRRQWRWQARYLHSLERELQELDHRIEHLA